MVVSPPEVIGQRLAKMRSVLEPTLAQHEWASKNGFNPTQYNNWEKGQRRIPIDSAAALADRYGLTLDYIYCGRRDGISGYAVTYT